jgi:hypothetical protein
MKKLLICITIALINLVVYAQTDSSLKEQNSIVEVYDVVAVYKEYTDSRGRSRKYSSELKGKIINHDQSTGFLTFQGKDGEMYSFTSLQYEYFKYNKEFTSKINQKKAINQRKEEGLGFHIGLSAGILRIWTGFQEDENYVGGTTGGGEQPVCIKLGLNKYVDKNNLVGLTAEYSLLGQGSSYFNAGARYQYLYNSAKNATFYLPTELKFSHYKTSYMFQSNDTTYFENYQTWPTDINADVALNALEINIGQGVSFALKNKRSLSLELMLLKQFILSQNLKVSNNLSPKTDFSMYGAKLSLFMNF